MDNVDHNPPSPLPLLRLPPPPPRETLTIFSPLTPTHHRKKRSKLTTTSEATSKTPYKKPDPLAPKITPPCTECGKTFWSWKALFGHMRCHPERQWRGINPPPHLRRNSPPLSMPSVLFTPSADEREVAACLLLLASSENTNVLTTTTTTTTMTAGLLRFKCSGCKKTFPSHQALGGHRASHKNVKGCYAVEEQGQNCNFIGNNIDEMDLGLGLVLGLGHKCVVCFKVFSSGQALGGHMRSHWEKTEDGSTSSFGPVLARYGLDLDLNLPAQVVEDVPVYSDNSIQIDLRLGI